MDTAPISIIDRDEGAEKPFLAGSSPTSIAYESRVYSAGAFWFAMAPGNPLPSRVCFTLFLTEDGSKTITLVAAPAAILPVAAGGFMVNFGSCTGPAYAESVPTYASSTSSASSTVFTLGAGDAASRERALFLDRVELCGGRMHRILIELQFPCPPPGTLFLPPAPFPVFTLGYNMLRSRNCTQGFAYSD
jgi:hypothetical protein